MPRQIINPTKRVGALDSKYAYEPEKLDRDVAAKAGCMHAKKSAIKHYLLKQFDNQLHPETVYDLIIDSVKEIKEELDL